VQQVFGLCIEGSRGTRQVNGDDTHIQGRRVPERNVSTVLPEGLIGDMIHGMFLKIRFVHNSFIGIFFYQGVSLTKVLVKYFLVLDYFIESDLTLLLYVDPGSEFTSSQQNPSKTISPPGRRGDSTVHGVHCTVPPKIVLWVDAIL